MQLKDIQDINKLIDSSNIIQANELKESETLKQSNEDLMKKITDYENQAKNKISSMQTQINNQKRESKEQLQTKLEQKNQEQNNSAQIEKDHKKLVDQMTELSKPIIEYEYRRKYIKEKKIRENYKKNYFLWTECYPTTDYYYEIKTEYQKRKRIIQNNVISYTDWEIYDTNTDFDPHYDVYTEIGTFYGWKTEKYYSGNSGEMNSTNEIKNP